MEGGGAERLCCTVQLGGEEEEDGKQFYQVPSSLKKRKKQLPKSIVYCLKVNGCFDPIRTNCLNVIRRDLLILFFSRVHTIYSMSQPNKNDLPTSMLPYNIIRQIQIQPK